MDSGRKPGSIFFHKNFAIFKNLSNFASDSNEPEISDSLTDSKNSIFALNTTKYFS